MKKLYIVKHQRDFDKIKKTGNIQKNYYFVIYFLGNKLPYDRFGISVGKKIGNAVHRNKYKRKIRAIIDNYKKIYVNNQDYIIILRERAKDKNYQELENSFLSLMSNIRKELKNEKEKQ